MTIYIPGDPIGKERPRHDPRHPERRPHTPEKTKAYEEKVKWEIKRQHPGISPIPRDRPIRMDIVAMFTIPKSASKKKRAAMLQGIIRPTKVPDADNICKSIMDAAQGIVFENDSSVVSVSVEKVYANEPGVAVHVREIEGANSPK